MSKKGEDSRKVIPLFKTDGENQAESMEKSEEQTATENFSDLERDFLFNQFATRLDHLHRLVNSQEKSHGMVAL